MRKISQYVHNMFITALFGCLFLIPSQSLAEYYPSLLDLEWQYGVYGTGIGKPGISAFDIDGDGQLELVVGGGSTFWYVVRQTGINEYQQAWISDWYQYPPAQIKRIATADADADGIGEIYVGLSNGEVKVHNGLSFEETGSFKAGNTVTDLVVADADGDGQAEVITTDGAKIYVYSAVMLTLEWMSSGYGGTSIAAGNVDSDPSSEIVTTTNGGHGYVIDGATHELKWDYINSFGNIVRLGDLDSDGRLEIVGAAAWGKVTILDADIKSPTWEIATSQDVGALAVADADGDGIPEILYGDGQWGKIHCHDAVTAVQRWTINNPEHGVTDIALADVNGAGLPEVIWGAGASSSGADYLYIADVNTRAIVWQSAGIDGPLSAVDTGDVDGDGQNEIVMVSSSSNSGYDNGIIHVFDAATHALEWSGPVEDIYMWSGVGSVKIGDVDGDEKSEFVLATAHLYDGLIQVYDGQSKALKHQSAAYSGASFTAMAIGDVDGDGAAEIVVGEKREHTGATGVYLIVFDGATLAEEWKSVDLGIYWGEIFDIKIADMDDDGQIEMIVSVTGNRIYVFDGVNHQMKWASGIAAYAVEVANIDSDSQDEILIGEGNGTVQVYDGATCTLEGTYSLGTGNITGLLVDDINQDGISEWLVGEASAFYVYDGGTKELLWEEDNLSGAFGYDHIISSDIDGDGGKEIIFGTNIALLEYEVGKAGITVATFPAGLQVEVDAVLSTGPQAFDWFIGSLHSVAVQSPQDGIAGTRYVFSSWSDGGAQSHSVNTPGSPVTLTADFTTQYLLAMSVNPAGAGTAGPHCQGGCWLDSGPSELLAIPASGYVVSGWSGACEGTTMGITVIMNMPKSCTANFALCESQPVKSGWSSYPSLQAALVGAADGDVLKILATTVSGYEFDRDISIALKGGYDCGFGVDDNYSFIQGALTVGRGTVTVEKLVIL